MYYSRRLSTLIALPGVLRLWLAGLRDVCHFFAPPCGPTGGAVNAISASSPFQDALLSCNIQWMTFSGNTVSSADQVGSLTSGQGGAGYFDNLVVEVMQTRVIHNRCLASPNVYFFSIFGSLMLWLFLTALLCGVGTVRSGREVDSSLLHLVPCPSRDPPPFSMLTFSFLFKNPCLLLCKKESRRCV